MSNESICSVFDVSGYQETNDVLFGVECEIEDIRNIPLSVQHNWGIHEDGSLRNSGREFVTPPVRREIAEMMFYQLHRDLGLGPEPFTERTSIHVHLNMQNLNVQEVKQIILLYALFEEFFFMPCEISRRDNIHCVALTDTVLPAYYGHGLGTLHGKWHKYTAMNVKPLNEYGTLEFRHMHGHNDQTLFARWLILLEKLVKVGSTMQPFSPTNFNDAYVKDLFCKLFNHFPQFDLWLSQLQEKTFNQKLDIKLSF